MHSVLIVDDNIKDITGIIKNIDWEELGFYVCGQANDGAEGLNKAIELQPDIIITDISMPIMNGIDMMYKIKEVIPNQLVIFMSCFDEFNFAKSAIDLRVNKYILKPICISELIESLINLAEIKRNELMRKIYKENLELKVKESLPLLQNEFYQELLFGKIINLDEISSRMKYLELDFEFDYISVMYLELDNYDINFGNLSIDEKYILIEKIQICINGTLSKRSHAFIVKQSVSSFFIIIFYENCSNEENALTLSINIANTCKEYINSILQTNVTIGVAEVSPSLEDIYGMAKSAEATVRSKFYSSGNSVLFNNNFSECYNEPDYSDNEIKTELSDLLENTDDILLSSFIEKYYGNIATYSKFHIKTLSYTIINILQNLLAERNLSFNDIFDNDVLIWEKLLKYETIVDIKQWIKNIVDLVRTHIQQREGNRYKKIVDDIKIYIDTNNMMIENVAQAVNPLNISVSYANSIFKSETGITIFDYLMKKKMDTARELLMDPYCRINTIADKLGYKSNAYFTYVFKQYNTVTPKEYRKRYCS